MKDLNIQIAIRIYEYEELSAADRELIDAALLPLLPAGDHPPQLCSLFALLGRGSGTPVRQYNRYRNQSGECSLSVGTLRGTHHLVLCQLPVPRPSRRDSCHSRPQRVRRISGRAYSAMRGLPAGDARNGKTLQTSHACTAVRENRHL